MVEPSAFSDPWVWSTAGAVAAAVAAGLVARRCISDGARHKASCEDAQRKAEKLEIMLGGLPDGWMRWDHATRGAQCSPRLAVLLGLPDGPDAGTEEVISRFAEADAARLSEAIRSLREHGSTFEILLPLSDETRTVQLLGRREFSDGGAVIADTLWARDVTHSYRLAGNARRHLDNLSVEIKRLRAMFDAMPVPIWVRANDLTIAFANNATGFPDPSRDLAERARAAGSAVTEVRAVSFASGMRPAEITEVSLVDGSILGFAMPLPERDFAVPDGDEVAQNDAQDLRPNFAQALSAASEPSPTAPSTGFEAAALDNLHVGVAVFGRDTVLRYFNQTYAALWQLDENWLHARPTYGEVVERLREHRRLPEFADFRGFKDEQLALFENLVDPVDAVMHLPDDTAVSSVVSRLPEGGLVFAYEDVTQHLQLESSYRTLVAVQRETLDNLSEGVAVFGPDGRLRLFNPAFAAMWGLSPDLLTPGGDKMPPHLSEIVDATRDFYDQAAHGDMFKWSEYRENLVTQFLGREARSGRMERTDDSILKWGCVPLPDGAVLLSYLDVSDSARVERALRERAEAVGAADRLKTEFLANMSYELRTPLATTLGFAEVLAGGYFGELTPRQAEYATGIVDSCQGVVALLDDIIVLTGVEGGQMSLELDTVEIHTVLVAVLGLVRERARHMNIELAFDCSPQIGWMVADEKRIKQVLFHLLSNAIKFSRHNGKVTLSARREADEVVIAVADTGIGIPSGEQAALFESFARSPSTAGSQVGAGLGLTLVKRFVELHGGRVELKSVVNEGTEVTCYLPSG